MQSCQQAFRVFGMQRSGNHAIIEWLIRNTVEKDTIFFNDCGFGHPITSFNSVSFSGQLHNSRVRKYLLTRPLRGVMEAASTRPNHIISYENKPVRMLGEFGRFITPGYPDDIDFKDIVIFRSFLNWLASFYKLKLRSRPKWIARINEEFIPIYAEHVAAASAADNVGVFYDEWSVNEEYRSSILSQLGLTIFDNKNATLATQGFPSMFDGEDAEPTEVATSERWREFTGDETFQNIVRQAFAEVRFRSLFAFEIERTPEVIEIFGLSESRTNAA